jgi:hypothetical protein
MRGRHTPTTSWKESRVPPCNCMSELFFSRRDPPVILIPAICLSSARLPTPVADLNRLFSPLHAVSR